MLSKEYRHTKNAFLYSLMSEIDVLVGSLLLFVIMLVVTKIRLDSLRIMTSAFCIVFHHFLTDISPQVIYARRHK